MKDGSDAIANWPLLNAILNTTSVVAAGYRWQRGNRLLPQLWPGQHSSWYRDGGPALTACLDRKPKYERHAARRCVQRSDQARQMATAHQLML